ncbi:MAG: segregation ATPase FtsK/SpoIIIE, family [Clostridiales bacterium]|nr:segregation ATPase FtsK/SpoIIIE, family [Clostridiales bacterium]
MRTERSHNVHKKRFKKSNNKALRNISILLTVFAVIALSFSNLSIRKLLTIFTLEILGTIIFMILALYITVHSKKTRRTNKRSALRKNAVKKEKKKYPVDAAIKSHKLIKLDKKKFNWSDEDIQRNPKTKKADEPIVKESTFVPYRSPFEPINPPPQQREEHSIDDAVADHTEQMTDNDGLDQDNNQPVYEEEDGSAAQDLLIEQEAVEEQVASTDEDLLLQKIQPFPKLKRRIKAVTVKKKKENDIGTSEKANIDSYIYPHVSLLSKNNTVLDEQLTKDQTEFSAKKLIDTLASFGVGARIINVSQGPSVTRYELQPNAGVKISKIVNLADDIALNLAAKEVRIEAPIPGKAAIGIEVPNQEVVPVFLREVIESEEFRKHPSKLAFAVGKDIAGNNIVADIARMPHMLIAGATASGKSVCINTLIASILYKASPSEVKLLMIDPKVVELGIYNGIPHLLIPVVTDPQKAAGALNWAVQEMTRRYQLFADSNVRDLRGYNALLKEKGEEDILPQIVIIIDELADLMMVAPNDVEDAICRLAQMARAAGMHLVIATQRPSVDVITGLIKANIPSRISFAVSSQVDSRTILDMAGAEKLLGKGDMLFSPMGQPKPIRIQGAFVSDKEVEAVVSFIKSNFSVEYDDKILETIDAQAESNTGDYEDEDELLSQAIEIAIEHGQASASLFQRKFKIGYARAARILDQMEVRGIVSGYEGSKPRQVLVTKQQWDEMSLQ